MKILQGRLEKEDKAYFEAQARARNPLHTNILLSQQNEDEEDRQAEEQVRASKGRFENNRHIYNEEEEAEKDEKSRRDNKKNDQSRKRNRQQMTSFKFLPSQKILADCRYCPENGSVDILSSSDNVYLALSSKNQFPGYIHLYLCPVQHVSSSLALENTVMDEINNYKKCLIQMFDSIGLHGVFFENYFKPNSHLCIEVLGIPSKKANDAPFYFKQGLNSSEGDWSNNSPIIEVKKEKGGLLKQIPKKFRYFYIDFSLGYGFAHIIEDEKRWSSTFAHQLLGALLGLDKHHALNYHRISSEEARVIKEKFSKSWKQFDWTTLL